MHRLAVVASHPIQYQAPWFRALAQVTDLEVFFCHRQDAAGQASAGFGVEFDWDVPLLDGYTSTWLTNRAASPDVSRFSGCDTPDISDLLKRGRFDACLITGWHLKSYLQAFAACRTLQIPTLMRGDSRLGTPRPAIRTIAKYLPYRWFLGRIDAHLFVGQANRQYLEHYGVQDSRLFFAPHFVDNEFFAHRAQQARNTGAAADLRRSLGIPADATVFTFAGKLLPNKRVSDLIRATATTHAVNHNASAIVIGDGPLRGELEQLAIAEQAPVRFVGFRNQSELPGFFAASDILVLPSQSETWGLVVNEAMACGLPAIVSTDTGCAADLIERGTTGEQFDTGNVEALALAMQTVTAALATNRRRIAEALAAKMETYSCATAVTGVLGALDSVISRPQPRRDRRSENTVAAAL